MSYLFGDSTPFPQPFDFLKTLEAFMTAGTRVVLLEHQARKVAEEAAAAQGERARGLETLERFHDGVIRAVDGAVVPQHPYAVEYAQRLAERAAGLVNEQRRSIQELDDADLLRVRGERERANEEVATHLRGFFRAARLPTLETKLSTRLAEGRPEATAVLAHPGGIGVSFTFGAARSPAWSAPRRLSDLVPHLELVAGIKKSWIGNKITREPLRLDDWVVGSAELEEAAATVAVRRKADQKDTLIFTMRRDGGTFSAEIAHPGDPNAGQVPSAAEAGDLPHLERLWTALLGTFDPLLAERPVVAGITLDGEDALARGLGQTLVERLVAVLAPPTLEVAQRSPNASELSLKREGSDGRREELYLKRAELLEALQPLPREGRAVFAPLGLDEWVPAMTMRPPAVG
jgi:hypothetical protein